MRRLLAIVCAAALALIVVLGVSAGNPTKEKIARTPAGNAEAAQLVVTRTDLPAGWSGGPAKPNLSSSMDCSSYRPKQSDLVLIGAAQTHWEKQGFGLFSETQVLRTPGMVKLDWQRSVTAPQVLPCLRQSFAKSVGKDGRLVSLRVIAIPHLVTYTKAYRVVVDVETPAGKRMIEFDALALGAGRDELTIALSGPSSAGASLQRLALQLARELAARLHG
jgi:hypothetical protein